MKGANTTAAAPRILTERELAAKFRDAFAELAAFYSSDPHTYRMLLSAVGGQLHMLSTIPGHAGDNIRYPGDPQ